MAEPAEKEKQWEALRKAARAPASPPALASTFSCLSSSGCTEAEYQNSLAAGSG